MARHAVADGARALRAREPRRHRDLPGGRLRALRTQGHPASTASPLERLRAPCGSSRSSCRGIRPGPRIAQHLIPCQVGRLCWEVSQLCSAAGKAPIPGAFKLTPTQCRRAADSHGPGLLLEVLLTCPRRDKKPVAAESPIAPTRCRPDTFADGPCPVASSGPTNRVRSSTSHPNPTVDRPQSDRSCEQTVQRRRPANGPVCSPSRP